MERTRNLSKPSLLYHIFTFWSLIRMVHRKLLTWSVQIIYNFMDRSWLYQHHLCLDLIRALCCVQNKQYYLEHAVLLVRRCVMGHYHHQWDTQLCILQTRLWMYFLCFRAYDSKFSISSDLLYVVSLSLFCIPSEWSIAKKVWSIEVKV